MPSAAILLLKASLNWENFADNKTSPYYQPCRRVPVNAVSSVLDLC
jgi:hypothetical protein